MLCEHNIFFSLRTRLVLVIITREIVKKIDWTATRERKKEGVFVCDWEEKGKEGGKKLFVTVQG